ncbi:hypothetical protein NHX12_025020 [Muraenolepis orangiensis]|uniref:Uncharacterized protein n=1 Tax=Muraenolepis orangiensis TaxID=630683 RepID=A0A9Q0EIJ9_9TELE|nr:hypothetical protein NHX12_025020 [Muraenolepis orangiensis]
MKGQVAVGHPAGFGGPAPDWSYGPGGQPPVRRGKSVEDLGDTGWAKERERMVRLHQVQQLHQLQVQQQQQQQVGFPGYGVVPGHPQGPMMFMGPGHPVPVPVHHGGMVCVPGGPMVGGPPAPPPGHNMQHAPWPVNWENHQPHMEYQNAEDLRPQSRDRYYHPGSEDGHLGLRRSERISKGQHCFYQGPEDYNSQHHSGEPPHHDDHGDPRGQERYDPSGEERQYDRNKQDHWVTERNYESDSYDSRRVRDADRKHYDIHRAQDYYEDRKHGPRERDEYDRRRQDSRYDERDSYSDDNRQRRVSDGDNDRYHDRYNDRDNHCKDRDYTDQREQDRYRRREDDRYDERKPKDRHIDEHYDRREKHYRDGNSRDCEGDHCDSARGERYGDDYDRRDSYDHRDEDHRGPRRRDPYRDADTSERRAEDRASPLKDRHDRRYDYSPKDRYDFEGGDRRREAERYDHSPRDRYDQHQRVEDRRWREGGGEHGDEAGTLQRREAREKFRDTRSLSMDSRYEEQPPDGSTEHCEKWVEEQNRKLKLGELHSFENPETYRSRAEEDQETGYESCPGGPVRKRGHKPVYLGSLDRNSFYRKTAPSSLKNSQFATTRKKKSGNDS